MDNRFYREPEPIGIGSIVIRFSMDGNGIDVGQIVAADETIRAQARWLVFANGRLQRWHSATITRKLKDWEEAAFVKGASEAVMQMLVSVPDGSVSAFQGAARVVLDSIANGSF